MNKNVLEDTIAKLFYLATVILVGVGFYKMFVYENGEGITKPVNAYVGGDAYNYIINATYAGDYFILALLCAFIGFAIQVITLLKKQTKQGE